MGNSGAKPFENNWAYLKTELRWLDRLLMLAVSRQRQDDKTLSRVANTPADKVSSHWWKGIITVNRGIDDREGPPPQSASKPATNVSYSQYLEHRIQVSQRAGIVLALPELRDRFSLTEVEKNILLLAIAPEVNRRYGRLYNYLQEDTGALEDLPTVDLCLRLLCRNDQAWQQARTRLTAHNSIVHQGLAEWIGDEDGTLLSQQVRLTDVVTNYLLADRPDPQILQLLPNRSIKHQDPVLQNGTSLDISGVTPSPEGKPDPLSALDKAEDSTKYLTSSQQVEKPWEKLVLPQKMIQQLQHLSRQAAQRQNYADVSGLTVLLVGASGTGKTISAATIAADLGISLTCVDLEVLTPESYPNILTDAPTDDLSLLLVKQGEHWFGRNPQVEQTWLHQWWQWRKQFYGLTLVTVHTLQAIRPSWRQKFDGILTFPHPDTKARCRLWEQAFASDFKVRDLDWAEIAKQAPFNGGEIRMIAQTVQMDLKARNQSTLTMRALRAAIALHHPHVEVQSIKRKRQ